MITIKLTKQWLNILFMLISMRKLHISYPELMYSVLVNLCNVLKLEAKRVVDYFVIHLSHSYLYGDF